MKTNSKIRFKVSDASDDKHNELLPVFGKDQ